MELILTKKRCIACVLVLMLAALPITAIYHKPSAILLTLPAIIAMIYFGFAFSKATASKKTQATHNHDTDTIQTLQSTLTNQVIAEIQRLENELDNATTLSREAADKTIESIQYVHVNVEREKQHIFSILNNIFRIHDSKILLKIEPHIDPKLCHAVHGAIDAMVDLANTQLILCDNIQMATEAAIDLCTNQKNLHSAKNSHAAESAQQISPMGEPQRIPVNYQITDEIERIKEYATQLLFFIQQDKSLEKAMAVKSNTNSDEIVIENEHTTILLDIRSEMEITYTGLQQSTLELSQILYSLVANLTAHKCILKLQSQLLTQHQTLADTEKRITDQLNELKQKTVPIPSGEIEARIKTIMQQDLGKIDRLVTVLYRESKQISDYGARLNNRSS